MPDDPPRHRRRQQGRHGHRDHQQPVDEDRVAEAQTVHGGPLDEQDDHRHAAEHRHPQEDRSEVDAEHPRGGGQAHVDQRRAHPQLDAYPRRQGHQPERAQAEDRQRTPSPSDCPLATARRLDAQARLRAAPLPRRPPARRCRSPASSPARPSGRPATPRAHRRPTRREPAGRRAGSWPPTPRTPSPGSRGRRRRPRSWRARRGSGRAVARAGVGGRWRRSAAPWRSRGPGARVRPAARRTSGPLRRRGSRHDDQQRRHEDRPGPVAVAEPGDHRRGDDADEQGDGQRPLRRLDGDTALAGDLEDDRAAQAGDDGAGERGEGQGRDQPARDRRRGGLLRRAGLGGPRVAQSSSRMVALAIPPPSHMVCSP